MTKPPFHLRTWREERGKNLLKFVVCFLCDGTVIVAVVVVLVVAADGGGGGEKIRFVASKLRK